MVTELGINMLVPIMVFGFIIVGAYMMSNWAFTDVIERRNKGEYCFDDSARKKARTFLFYCRLIKALL